MAVPADGEETAYNFPLLSLNAQNKSPTGPQGPSPPPLPAVGALPVPVAGLPTVPTVPGLPRNKLLKPSFKLAVKKVGPKITIKDSLPKVKGGALTAGVGLNLAAICAMKIKDEELEDTSGLYTPVEFEIVTPPLPFMGPDYRKIGKVKRISRETVAMKKNGVHGVNLDKKKDEIKKGEERAKKEYTRTLLMWHLEGQRHQDHKDLALERRSNRIIKFFDKLSDHSDDFHFNSTFFADIASSEFDPESPVPPLKPTQKRPLPKRKERPITKSSFSKTAVKQEAIAARFKDCELAGRISGLTYIKLYTDPYYRFLPPLSSASKKYDIRLARLPHKELRDERLWAAFVKSLERKPTPPPAKPETKLPDFGVLARERSEQLRRRLPVISVLPKWLQQVKFNQTCAINVAEVPQPRKPKSRGGDGGLRPAAVSPSGSHSSKLKRKHRVGTR